jgi:sulfate adenylyltransferase subunit 1
MAASTNNTAQGPLRLLTAGSVDDGKSTLIGRLLWDSQALMADQVRALEGRSVQGRPANDAHTPIDLSLLTDGLEAEREQGITIDVAWRYFATPRRKFVIADAPGHEQYTRNMVTAAAGSDAAVVLVDLVKLQAASKGFTQDVALLPQTRRHALLAQLLRVPHLVFALNKIDAVADAPRAFAAVKAALEAFCAAAGIVPAGIVPVSALRGDNVVQPTAAGSAAQSGSALGYRGPALLDLLESLPTRRAESKQAWPALPVQYVAVQQEAGQPQRVLWGRLSEAPLAVGDAVQHLPSRQRAQVLSLWHQGQPVARGEPGQSIGVVLDQALDVSRGDWLLAPGQAEPSQRFTATLAWLDVEPAQIGRRYLVRHAQAWTAARIVAIRHRLDIHTLARESAGQLAVNDIGEVEVELQQPLPLRPYRESMEAGALIVVDPTTHRTSGALLVAAVADTPGVAA